MCPGLCVVLLQRVSRADLGWSKRGLGLLCNGCSTLVLVLLEGGTARAASSLLAADRSVTATPES